MKRLRQLLAAISLMLLLSLAAGYFLVASERGLQLVHRVLQSQYADIVEIGQLQGSLASVIEIDNLRLRVNQDVYQIARLTLDWSPRWLLGGELRVNRLDARAVDVFIAGSSEPGDNDFVIDVELPVSISLSKATLSGLTIHGADETATHINAVSLSARAVDERLMIDSLQLDADGYSAALSGSLGLRPGKTSNFQVNWSFDSESVAITGQAVVAGLLDAYTLEGETTLSGTDFPVGQWRFTAAGDLQALTISELVGNTLEGRVSGVGGIDWQQGFGWNATVQMQQLNPASHWPEWPGELSSGFTTEGRVGNGGVQASMQLHQLTGQLRGYPVKGEADIRFDKDQIDIQQLDLQSGDNTFKASGSVDQRWQLATQANIVDMAALLPGWNGSFRFNGNVSGERDQPRIDVTATGEQLSGPGIVIESVTAQAQLVWSEDANQSIRISLATAEIAGQRYKDASLEVNGLLRRHQLALNATGRDARIDIQLSGDWRTDSWSGELRKADWGFPATGAWTLTGPVAATLGEKSVQLQDLCWQQGQAYLCLDVQGDPTGSLSARAQLKQFPLAALDVFSTSQLQISNRVDATAQAGFDAGQLVTADVLASTGAGNISYDDPSLPSESLIEQGELRAQLNTLGLTASSSIDLAGRDYLRASLDLPGFQPGRTPWETQSLALKVNGELDDMLFVQYLLDEIGRFEGAMVVDLSGTGTLARPRFSGGANISDGTLEIDALGINLTDLDLQLSSKQDGLLLDGSCDSGEGSVRLSGEVNVIDIARWQADVSLQGKDFEVMHLPESVISVSPDIRAQIAPPSIKLSGAVHVPYARLRPKDLKTRAGVSSDVVIVDEAQVEAPQERWQVSSDLRLSLGDDVTIDGYGLKGDILGAVNLLDTPGKVMTAQGKLSIERGSYEIYGRKLDIHRGQLLFSGGPVDNPGLDFEASRKVEGVTAGVRARGSLREPELSLYSDPTMGDSDIISYIAFGKPQAEAGQGGGSVTDAGLVAGGNMLAGVIGTKVGLEEFGVEGGETLEEAAMVLGTYLSPQLYVRYRTGLYDAINEFEVRYEFTRRWSVRTITSVENSSAEVQFSFER